MPLRENFLSLLVDVSVPKSAAEATGVTSKTGPRLNQNGCRHARLRGFDCLLVLACLHHVFRLRKASMTSNGDCTVEIPSPICWTRLSAKFPRNSPAIFKYLILSGLSPAILVQVASTATESSPKTRT